MPSSLLLPGAAGRCGDGIGDGAGAEPRRRGDVSDVAGLDFSSIEDGLPAFVTLVLIPLTFSITQGILWGFILHALLYTVSGRARGVPLAMWMLALLSVALLPLGR